MRTPLMVDECRTVLLGNDFESSVHLACSTCLVEFGDYHLGKFANHVFSCEAAATPEGVRVADHGQLAVHKVVDSGETWNVVMNMSAWSKREQGVDAPLVCRHDDPSHDFGRENWRLYVLRETSRPRVRGYAAFRDYDAAPAVLQDLWLYPGIRGSGAADVLVSAALEAEGLLRDREKLWLNAPITRGTALLFRRFAFSHLNLFYAGGRHLERNVDLQRWDNHCEPRVPKPGSRLEPKAINLFCHPHFVKADLHQRRARIRRWLIPFGLASGVVAPIASYWGAQAIWQTSSAQMDTATWVLVILPWILPTTVALAHYGLRNRAYTSRVEQYRLDWWRNLELRRQPQCPDELPIMQRVVAELSYTRALGREPDLLNATFSELLKARPETIAEALALGTKVRANESLLRALTKAWMNDGATLSENAYASATDALVRELDGKVGLGFDLVDRGQFAAVLETLGPLMQMQNHIFQVDHAEWSAQPRVRALVHVAYCQLFFSHASLCAEDPSRHVPEAFATLDQVLRAAPHIPSDCPSDDFSETHARVQNQNYRDALIGANEWLRCWGRPAAIAYGVPSRVVDESTTRVTKRLEEVAASLKA